MIIKEIAFGNREEAFIENRFTNKTNIVFSNENNRGKTLLMQSLMFSIGYDSIFPSGFNYRDFYYYSKIEFKEKEFEFLRKKNSILVNNTSGIQIFNSVSEFKYYFDIEIFKLPRIPKNDIVKAVDLSLLYELFFLGQDKRNPSNLISKGQNNKADFINMIYALEGVNFDESDPQEMENLRNLKQELESKIKLDKKKLGIIKKDKSIANQVSSAANNIEFQSLRTRLNEINQSITNLRTIRNREENRKLKLENLITELNSLNRNLNSGKVKCSDCGSKKVIFSNEDFEFDVSNDFVRKSILKSIESNISLKGEIINEYNKDINKEQLLLNQLIISTPPEAKNFLIFQDEIISSVEVDRRIALYQTELDIVINKIDNILKIIQRVKNIQSSYIGMIIQTMQKFYGIIDPNGVLTFEDIFTKNDQTFSGSESQEYYFCKLMALNEELKHPFPILIDSFRDGEISTAKETLMIEEFKKLDKQVIITSTLKDEEYESGKYVMIEGVNIIDYSSFEDSKILQPRYAEEFIKLLNKFNVS